MRFRSFPRRLAAGVLSALLTVSLLGACSDDSNDDTPAETGPGSGPQDEGG